MPSFEEHRQKCDIARSAQLSLQAADPSAHADWIVITAFYQALHWVDAFFALNNRQPTRHGERKRFVDQHENLERISESYTNLYDASIIARYEPETYKDDPDEVEALLEEDLALIVTHINELINQAQA
ncbi:hypothetical protein F4X33_16790 [Candidatus Poribacteria bacterium]|nr:hypothetical protein [Candidatus Poribacteria bacterium]